MAKYLIQWNELGPCHICDHCIEKDHPLYYCGCGNNNFGKIDYPDECNQYEPLGDDDEED